jgi:FlaA1/EpsC-like NDP-sugar epimerase
MSNANGEQRLKPRVWWALLLTRKTQFALDLIILIIAFSLAYLLRFDFDIPRDNTGPMLKQLPYVVLIEFAALVMAGVYTFIWRYIGMAEIRAFINAAYWSFLPILLLRLGMPETLHQWRVPLSIIFINTGLAFGGVLGLRVVRRALYERYEKQVKARVGNGHKKPVLLIGAGRAGVLAARELRGRGDTDLDIKGFIDDDAEKQGAVIYGVKVLGKTADIVEIVERLNIDHVVITMAEASRDEIRRIVSICEHIPIKIRIIPGLYEILQGQVEVSRIRDIQVEDLLGRDPVQLDEDGIKEFLAGRVVMVTGAGGSIGAELARQAARFRPSKLLLVERAEFALFNADRQLRDDFSDLSILPLVADVCDEMRMRSIFSAYRPEVVLHAAAHKHVPMMESNETEAVKNNVLATRLLGELAGEFGADGFVLISTDKAVRPTSVMGASKRVAELVVQDLDRRYSTRYVAVRFGNVMGSAGSVIPIFREQIRKGGPVTVTHPDMVRYFMTIPEAAQLVLQAGALGEGGEIFILDMGEPIKILDLAKDTITLSGLKPHEDIEIIFTGVRAGEKLFEELEITEERLARTRHPKIFIGKIAAYPEETVRQALTRLTILSQDGQERELRLFLSELLPEAKLAAETGLAQPTAEPDIDDNRVKLQPAEASAGL